MTSHRLSRNREAVIAAATGLAIGVSATLVFAGAAPPIVRAPLVVAVVAGGVPLLGALVRSALRREIGADFLAGLAIVTSLLLGQFLVAAVVVLMLSGGQALESYATRRASSGTRSAGPSESVRGASDDRRRARRRADRRRDARCTRW